jgi:hypothetical protein
MVSRIFFAATAAFWVVMSVLLWRSQSAAHSGLGSAVPVDVVWDKILTSPDSSSLDIFDHEKNIGRCEWKATVGSVSQAMEKSLSEDYEPDGLIQQPTGYSLSVNNGQATIFGTNRIIFDFRLLLATNRAWQDFHLTGKMRPMTWDIHAIAASRKVMVKITYNGVVWQKALKFSDFDHPETLLEELGEAGILDFFGPGDLSLEKESIEQAAAGLKWEAHEDWMQFGHSRTRVYRLETGFLGMNFYLFTSRVGEILWVEGPNKLTVRNTAFSHF